MLLDSSILLVDSMVEEVSYVDSNSNPSCRLRLMDSSLCLTALALRLCQSPSLALLLCAFNKMN